jgi:phage FluMu protein Com
MSVRIKGSNAYGHLGWITKYCRICNRKLKVGIDVVYKCPKCEKVYNAYFCEAFIINARTAAPNWCQWLDSNQEVLY